MTRRLLLCASLLALCPALARDQAAAAWTRKVPVAAGARVNPYAGQSDAIAAGAKLFQHHCAACHRQDAGGAGRVPSLLSPAVQNATPGSLFWLLRNGIIRRGMPSWSHLPEQQRWQIITYLGSIR